MDSNFVETALQTIGFILNEMAHFMPECGGDYDYPACSETNCKGKRECKLKSGIQIRVKSLVEFLAQKNTRIDWKETLGLLLSNDCPPGYEVKGAKCEAWVVCNDCWKDWYKKQCG